MFDVLACLAVTYGTQRSSDSVDLTRRVLQLDAMSLKRFDVLQKHGLERNWFLTGSHCGRLWDALKGGFEERANKYCIVTSPTCLKGPGFVSDPVPTSSLRCVVDEISSLAIRYLLDITPRVSSRFWFSVRVSVILLTSCHLGSLNILVNTWFEPLASDSIECRKNVDAM